MYCKNCGAQLKDGDAFCISCGAKVEQAGPTEQAQSPQPPYGQPYQQQPPKQPKTLLWVIISVVAVLAIAAVLIFIVFPIGKDQPADAAGDKVADTPQEQFFEDGVEVFTGAFKGFETDTFERLGKEPFEMNYDITMEMMGQEFEVSLDAAYDEEALGLVVELMGMENKILLLEDVLYTESMGTTSGIDFDSDADLSGKMTLTDRMTALAGGISSMMPEVPDLDYMELLEMFLNSIDESCIEKGSGKTTLTLDADDVINALTAFKEKIQEDEEMIGDIEDSIENTSGEEVDLVKKIDEAIEYLEEESDDFEIICEISYDGNEPVGIDVSFDSKETDVEVSFEYEETDKGVKITFSVLVDDEMSDEGELVEGELIYNKTSDGIDYECTITAEGESMVVEGSEEWDGDKTTGEISLDIPDAGEFNLTYEGTLKFGMPPEVESDSRFEVDTEGAEITKMDDMSNMLGGSMMPAF